MNRIVHLVNTLGLDGTSKVVLSLAKVFQGEYELHIIAINQNAKDLREVFLPSSVHFHSFNIPEDKDYSLIGYLKNLFFINRWRVKYELIIDLIRQLDPAILHAHLQPRELMIINASRSLSRLKLIYTDHSTRIRPAEYSWVNRNLLAWVYRNMYRKFHVVAVSESVVAYHRFFKIVSKDKLYWLICNTVDINRFIPVETRVGELIRVIYVARLHLNKGHETLIRAWASIRTAKSCELVLVGGGNDADKEYFKELTESVKSKFPIIFTGSTDEVLSYLHSSDIAVFPSLNEGLPISLLEKMSCGLPVVASNIPEFQGIIKDGENGLLFETGNTVQLSEKLQQLIDDPLLRRRIGENARKFIVKSYSNHEFSMEYRDAYKKVLSR